MRARIFFQGHFGHFWGPRRVFFQGLGQFSELAGGFTFLIAALYWMIRVSKFNHDIFKLIAACSPSPLAISGAAGRLIFDTPVAGDDHLMMIMTIFE